MQKSNKRLWLEKAQKIYVPGNKFERNHAYCKLNIEIKLVLK